MIYYVGSHNQYLNFVGFPPTCRFASSKVLLSNFLQGPPSYLSNVKYVCLSQPYGEVATNYRYKVLTTGEFIVVILLYRALYLKPR